MPLPLWKPGRGCPGPAGGARARQAAPRSARRPLGGGRAGPGRGGGTPGPGAEPQQLGGPHRSPPTAAGPRNPANPGARSLCYGCSLSFRPLPARSFLAPQQIVWRKQKRRGMRRSLETRQDVSRAGPEALAICPKCLSLGLVTIIIARFDEVHTVFLKKNVIYVTNVPLVASLALCHNARKRLAG